MPAPNAARWAELAPRIDELLTLPPLEREGWLHDLAANEPDTAAQLRALLVAREAASRVSFLGGVAEQALLPPSVAAGETLGSWALVDVVGEGGMGSVWRARRADGHYEGEAAIKLLRTGLFDTEARERFRREGAILARLQHPGIAQLLDAGVTERGQPYLVLELVRGERIDRWCAARALGVRARVALFAQVLDAVAAAHSQLVIHRDLKPSNILVDDAGRVKLLDFGIARLIGDDAGPGLTQEGAAALTPQYAAPEQFNAGVLSMATDVFALGVVLYELLTGVHPSGLVSAAPLQYLRAASEESHRLASEQAPALRRELRGDLDNILAKALAAAPLDRYAGVAAFGDDLRRHLNDEPVVARPGSWPYRAAKFARRNRLAVAAAAAVFAAVAVGLAATLWMAAEASRQRDTALAEAERARKAQTRAVQFQHESEAQAARADLKAEEALAQEALARESAERAQRESLRANRSADAATQALQQAATERTRALAEAAQARRQAQRATAVQGFLTDLFSTNGLAQADPLAAQKVTARELLDRGAERLDTALAGQPESQLEIAKTLGGLYGELTLNEKALLFRRKQAALSESLNGASHIETGQALAAQAELLRPTEPAEALVMARRAERIFETQRDTSSSEFGVLQITLADLSLGSDLALAEKHARVALQVFTARHDAVHQGLATTRLGVVSFRRGDVSGAEAHYQRAVQIYEAAGDAANPVITSSYSNLAFMQELQLKFDAAEKSNRLAVAATERINGPHHASTVVFRSNYADALVSSSHLPEALSVARKSMADLQTAPAEHQRAYLRRAQRSLGEIEVEYGMVGEGGALLEEAAAAEATIDPRSRRAGDYALVAARAALQRGDLARAAQHIDTLRNVIAAAPAGSTASMRASLNGIQARHDAASGRCAETLAALNQDKATQRPASFTQFRAALNEAELRVECHDFAAAAELAGATLRAIEERGLQGPLALFASRLEVVGAQAALERRDAPEAERRARAALGVQATQLSGISPRLADTRLLLGLALVAQGRAAEAREPIEAARAALAQHSALDPRHRGLLDATQRALAASR